MKCARQSGLFRVKAVVLCRFTLIRDTLLYKSRPVRCSIVLLFGLGTLGFALWTSAAMQDQTNAGGADYRNFEVIAKKNIFNPRRSPAYQPREKQPTVYRKTETFALVGVMSYGKGPMAFFEGSKTEYKQVLKPNDSIGGFKVTAIEPTSVKLASSTNEIEVQVGMQMAREDGGDWKLSVHPESLELAVHDSPMRSASAINAERASTATNENGNNPLGAIGNLFNGFRGGGGFPGGFTGIPTAVTPTTPAPITQPATPGNPSDILTRLARQAALDRGETPPDQQGAPSTNPGTATPQPNVPADPPNPQGQTVPNPGELLPNPDGQPLPSPQTPNH